MDLLISPYLCKILSWVIGSVFTIFISVQTGIIILLIKHDRKIGVIDTNLKMLLVDKKLI